MVSQGLGRSHNDGIAGMDTHRVKVLHVADSNAVVVAVTHYLVLDFLPACHAALNQHLADHGILQALDNDINQLVLALGNTAAGAAHGIGRAHNQRIADFVGKGNSRCHVLNNGGLRDRLTQLIHGFLEQLAVLGTLNCLQRSTQQLYVVFLKDALLRQLYGQIEAGLTS